MHRLSKAFFFFYFNNLLVLSNVTNSGFINYLIRFNYVLFHSIEQILRLIIRYIRQLSGKI